jgi:hypothetical protein
MRTDPCAIFQAANSWRMEAAEDPFE